MFQRNTLPGIGHLAQTYAAGPVWGGSTTLPIQWQRTPKAQARKIFHHAAAWDRATREKGKHGGVIGKAGKAILHTLIFDFLCYKTGRLDPSYEGIAKRSGYSRATVAVALRRLRDAGILAWVRRCTGFMRDGRYVLEQERNAYAVLPVGNWRGFRPAPAPPASPLRGTWGDTPSLPTALEQADNDRKMGLSTPSVLHTLQSDPTDSLALALARFGDALTKRQRTSH